MYVVGTVYTSHSPMIWGIHHVVLTSTTFMLYASTLSTKQQLTSNTCDVCWWGNPLRGVVALRALWGPTGPFGPFRAVVPAGL